MPGDRVAGQIRVIGGGEVGNGVYMGIVEVVRGQVVWVGVVGIRKRLWSGLVVSVARRTARVSTVWRVVEVLWVGGMHLQEMPSTRRRVVGRRARHVHTREFCQQRSASYATTEIHSQDDLDAVDDDDGCLDFFVRAETKHCVVWRCLASRLKP